MCFMANHIRISVFLQGLFCVTGSILNTVCRGSVLLGHKSITAALLQQRPAGVLSTRNSGVADYHLLKPKD